MIEIAIIVDTHFQLFNKYLNIFQIIQRVSFYILLFLAAPLLSYSQSPEIEWQNTIGGLSSDNLYSLKQTTDGGYILAGNSSSELSGDKTEIGNGGADYWIIKLDSTGNIIWQNTIGGNSSDQLRAIVQCFDGGYLLGGYSLSGNSGDKEENSIGSNDYWIVKTDSLGEIIWQNTIGGGLQDKLTSVRQTIDKGFIIGGYSGSDISGDKTETNYGGLDYWIIKTDSLGNIEWDKSFGGEGDDYLYSIVQTSDKGYFLGGYSNSGISGNKTEPTIGLTGLSDYWVLKLDSFGVIVWQNTIGGNDGDYLTSNCETFDGGYLLGGYSSSGISGDKAENCFGFEDYWLVKIDSLGEILWQNTIGGFSSDRLTSVSNMIDGGYIIGGFSDSNISIDKSEEGFGSYDYWVVKINSIGTVQWDKTIGGSDYDYQYSVDQVLIEPGLDLGVVIGGSSQSGISGNKTEANMGIPGFSDYWVIKLFPEECIPSNYYADADEDGFGNMFISISSCIAPIGYILDSTDCNDSDSSINPLSSELCNEYDDNCNLLIDEGLTFYSYYIDEDEDGYGNIFFEINTCQETPPIGYVVDNSDCDDSENIIHEPILYYADVDGDLYGDLSNTALLCALIPPFGFVTNSLDCDDENILVNPVTNEICNLVDDNCNLEIDEGLPTQMLYQDMDEDGYGNPSVDSLTCMIGVIGYTTSNTDCNDSDPSIYPGADEILNGVDDDCNNIIDEGLPINDYLDHLGLKIFPNPNLGKFYISFETSNLLDLSVDIYNLFGGKIYSNHFNSNEIIEINLPHSFTGIANVVIILEKSMEHNIGNVGDGNIYISRLISIIE